MADSYFFDKRVIKRNTIKYSIIFVIILPIFVGLNFLLNGLTASWVAILIDVIVGFFLIIGLGFIYDKIYNKRMEKREQKIKEFRKRQRLEASLDSEEIEIEEEPKAKANSNSQVKKKRKRRNRNKGINNG